MIQKLDIIKLLIFMEEILFLHIFQKINQVTPYFSILLIKNTNLISYLNSIFLYTVFKFFYF